MSNVPSLWKKFDTTTLADAGHRASFERYPALADEGAAALEAASVGPVRCILLADRAFNAAARSVGQEQWVGVNVAVPCILHFCFNVLLRHPDVFPTVGDASNEEIPLFERGIPPRLPPAMDLVDALVTLPGLSRPKDDQRTAAASTLAELATAFCVFHEVGHVAAGHARFQQQQFRDDSEGLVEFFTWRRKKHAALELRRVWEFEADKIAAMLLLSWIRTDDAMRKDSCVALDLDGSAEALAGAALFALHILFRFLWQVKRDFRASDVHPDPLVRSLTAHGVLLALETEGWTRDTPAVEQGFGRVSEAADAAWASLAAPMAESWTRKSSHSLWSEAEGQLLQLEEAHGRVRSQYESLGTLGELFWKTHRRE